MLKYLRDLTLGSTPSDPQYQNLCWGRSGCCKWQVVDIVPYVNVGVICTCGKGGSCRVPTFSLEVGMGLIGMSMENIKSTVSWNLTSEGDSGGGDGTNPNNIYWKVFGRGNYGGDNGLSLWTYVGEKSSSYLSWIISINVFLTDFICNL